MAGLYIHIPFCRQRCSYCDFYFVTGGRYIEPFVDALIHEIETTPVRLTKEPVETVYFGGGTPSRLPVGQLDRISAVLSRRFSIADDAEWTIEINPDDSSAAYLGKLRAMNFNRLSIGIQSLKAADLEFMRRAHTTQQAIRVVETARESGFKALSIDLIFGVPGQRLRDWMTGIQFAIEQTIPHISTYGLTVEPGTLFNKWIEGGKASRPDEESMSEMYLSTIEALTAAGYRHYETSSFSLPGSESRHNRAYWQHKNYLGFGPSAHSFWWSPAEPDPVSRWSNVRSLRRYIAPPTEYGGSIDQVESLTMDELAVERIMLGLRTSDGIARRELKERYRLDVNEAGEELIAQLVQEGLMTDDETTLRLTPSGHLLADAITGELCSKMADPDQSPGSIRSSAAFGGA